jgi:WD40 repeat protein
MSATGGHVVYESREATSNVHRSALDLDRAVLGPSTAITSGSRIFSFVDPSPSGESLVLGTGYLQQEDLFISGVDGANLRQLTNDLANDRYPEWSPDGSTIAFYSDRTGKYEIWTSTSSGQLTQLTNASDFSTIYPHWSPTGDRMTFSDVGRGRVVATFDPRKPWPDQKPDVLPPPAGPGSYLEGVGVRWSPDGKELAGSVNGIVTIYNIASRTYRRVPGDVRGVVNAWLRDGRLLVGPATPLRLVDPKTGQSRPVSTPPLPATVNLRLSRDERTGYFILTKSETDIWLVTIAGR